MTPKFDHTFAGTKSNKISVEIFGVMITTMTNVCLDNLHSCFGKKTLHAEIETITNPLLTVHSPLAPLGQVDEWAAKPSQLFIRTSSNYMAAKTLKFQVSSFKFIKFAGKSLYNNHLLQIAS